MRQHGGQEDQRRHAKWNFGAGRVGLGVDLLDDEVIARVHRLAKVEVEQAADQAGDWQQGDEPGVGLAGGGRPVEQHDEQRRGRPGEEADHDAQDEPAKRVAKFIEKAHGVSYGMIVGVISRASKIRMPAVMAGPLSPWLLRLF